ncbi:MAG: hypothetical protein LAN37_06935 [Acidobacteriia bacterium]|nr:hypothetical protein [Terriglobia bacterium]
MEAVAKNWAVFGQQLRVLAQSKGQALGRELRSDSEPAIARETDSLLNGRALTIAEFNDLQARVVTATKFIPTWLDLWSRLKKLGPGLPEFVQSHHDYVEAHRDKVAKVQQAAEQTWVEIWGLDSADATKVKKAHEDVSSLESAYAQLLVDAGVTTPALAVQAPVLAGFGLYSPRTYGAYRSTRSAADYLAEIKHRDRLLGMLAYLTAILTGLSMNYFGQNFGTVHDYVKLFLWAFGAKVAVDALANSLERWLRPGSL